MGDGGGCRRGSSAVTLEPDASRSARGSRLVGLRQTGPVVPEPVEELDVVVVGAGLSGIGAACHLARDCPEESVVVLEARDHVGGTWDLFRYPGVRSDSSMFT